MSERVLGIAIYKDGTERIEFEYFLTAREIVVNVGADVCCMTTGSMRRWKCANSDVVGWRVERRFADGRVVVMAQTKENAFA